MDEKRFLIIIFVLSSLFNIAISFFIELWPLGHDPISHYQDALGILDGKLPADRTFLYNGILSIFLYFKRDYWVAQIVNAFISSLFIIPFYYIAKKHFGKKNAVWSLILICIIPFRIFGVATTSKLLATFFIFIVYYFVLEKRYSWWIVMASILAFLTHQLSLFFLIPAFYLILRDDWKRAIYLASLLGLVIITWMFFNKGESMFIYFPFAVEGWESVRAEPENVIPTFMSTPIHNIIFVRIINSLIPITPLLFPAVKTINIFYPIVLNIHKTIDFSIQPWAYHYIQSFSGHVGILLYLFVMLGVWRLKKTRLVFLIAFSYVIIVLYYGWINPLTSAAGLAFTPLFVMMGVSQVYMTKNKNKWMVLIILSLIIEFALMLITFFWFIDFTKANLIASGSFGEYIKLNSLWKIVH